MAELGDTPWVDRAWRSSFERVAERVPASWMPRRRQGRPVRFEEYGCGHYGCVMPTDEAGLVVKVTSDPAEALFVSWALSVDKPEYGIVDYKRILTIDGGSRRGRPLFILWRSEAFDVGVLMKMSGMFHPDVYERRKANEGLRSLEHVKIEAGKVRDTLKRWRNKADDETYNRFLGQVWKAFENGSGPNRWANELAERIGIVRGEMQSLENTYLVDGVGHAMLHYLDMGVLLADVHGQNIGRAAPDEAQLLITDPGHAVVLDPTVEIPEIELI